MQNISTITHRLLTKGIFFIDILSLITATKFGSYRYLHKRNQQGDFYNKLHLSLHFVLIHGIPACHLFLIEIQ